jgi:hypothetical protein
MQRQMGDDITRGFQLWLVWPLAHTALITVVYPEFKPLGQSLNDSFRQAIFNFFVPWHWLTLARLRISVPIMVATMAHKHTTY